MFRFSESSLDGGIDSALLRFGLVPLEGRLAIVTDAGRDAVDAEVPITNGTDADGEVVWSRHPDAGVRLAGSIPLTTVANKPGTPGRARRKPLKPLRGECRVKPV